MKQILLILPILFISLADTHAVELTLKECIELALEKNSGLKSFEMDALASEEDVKKSYASFFPFTETQKQLPKNRFRDKKKKQRFEPLAKV